MLLQKTPLKAFLNLSVRNSNCNNFGADSISRRVYPVLFFLLFFFGGGGGSSCFSLRKCSLFVCQFSSSFPGFWGNGNHLGADSTCLSAPKCAPKSGAIAIRITTTNRKPLVIISGDVKASARRCCPQLETAMKSQKMCVCVFFCGSIFLHTVGLCCLHLKLACSFYFRLKFGLVFFSEKSPRAFKKIGTPPPPQTQNPPPPKKRGILWTWKFSCRKKAFFQVSVKLAQPFPAPELRTRILRTRGFF